MTCLTCGEVFTVTAHRADTARYCSRPCYTSAQRRHAPKVEQECVVCGKRFYRSPSKVHPGRPCCGVACRATLRRSTEARGERNYRDWLLRRVPRPDACPRCGYDAHPEILVVHHLDLNGRNHRRENLAWMCPNCHAVAHLNRP